MRRGYQQKFSCLSLIHSKKKKKKKKKKKTHTDFYKSNILKIVDD